MKILSSSSLFRVTAWQQSCGSLRRSRSQRIFCRQPTKNGSYVRPDSCLGYSQLNVYLSITPNLKHEPLIQNP
mgnify:CR=1 FL=1